MTASWERILEVSGSHAHFLEFHNPGDRHIGQSAGRFLCGALKAGGIAVAIADARNTTGIVMQVARTGADPAQAKDDGSLLTYDSAEMLAEFLRGRTIDVEQFSGTVGAVMRDAHRRANGAPLRAFGDMVGVLWQRGDRDAAVELERLWNGLQEELGFALFCSYGIDVFGPQFCIEELRGVFDSHSHVFPSWSSTERSRALERALDDVLGSESAEVRMRVASGSAQSLPPMPKAEQMILRLRTLLPHAAPAVLRRARELYETGAPRVYLREEHSHG